MLLTNPGQVSSHDFVGCMRAPSVNDVSLLRMTPESVERVVDGCPRDQETRCRPGVCQNEAVCVDEWDAHRCECPVGYAGNDCSMGEWTFSVN